ncbi:MAG: hypothetical protein HY320_08720 [Armatimonadetes bacterium]|nr:hypothetical protein [Armatimonadota bacterium]
MSMHASRERVRHAVYLVDPGPLGAPLIMFLERLTGMSTAECVEMVRRIPSLIFVCDDPQEANELVARLRELKALAVVRPTDRPLKEGSAPVDAPRASGQRLFDALMTLLGLVQIGIGIFWWMEGRLLAGAAGVLLGLVVAAYFTYRFPRD